MIQSDWKSNIILKAGSIDVAEQALSLQGHPKSTTAQKEINQSYNRDFSGLIFEKIPANQR